MPKDSYPERRADADEQRVPRGTDDLPIPEQGFQHSDVPKRLPDEY